MEHGRFGYPGLFAAYNAGRARYASVLVGKSRLPAETRSYVTLMGADGAAASLVKRGRIKHKMSRNRRPGSR